MSNETRTVRITVRGHNPREVEFLADSVERIEEELEQATEARTCLKCGGLSVNSGDRIMGHPPCDCGEKLVFVDDIEILDE